MILMSGRGVLITSYIYRWDHIRQQWEMVPITHLHRIDSDDIEDAPDVSNEPYEHPAPTTGRMPREAGE